MQATAAATSRETGEALGPMWRRVDRYAREIVPSFNAYLYFRIGYAIARAVARMLYRVRIGYVDEAALARIDPKSTIVFVINHRSNMDYVLVAFLAAERAALSYAVGEWARIWPLQQLVRAMGAYFVRRNSGDALYRTVLARYVQMATEAGVTQAVFPEGGLSVDGRLRPPKFGLLDYMLKGFDDAKETASATSCSSRSASTTTACWKTAASCSSCDPQRRRPGSAARRWRRALGFRATQALARGHRPLAPFRLCLRQFRRAALDARLRAANARDAFPGARRRGAARRGERCRDALMEGSAGSYRCCRCRWWPASCSRAADVR